MAQRVSPSRVLQRIISGHFVWKLVSYNLRSVGLASMNGSFLEERCVPKSVVVELQLGTQDGGHVRDVRNSLSMEKVIAFDDHYRARGTSTTTNQPTDLVNSSQDDRGMCAEWSLLGG